jgi:UDP-N-acetylmuramyl tripeptide synthase
MGNIATKKSTLAIITSDNPRTEDPAAIIKKLKQVLNLRISANTLQFLIEKKR